MTCRHIAVALLFTVFASLNVRAQLPCESALLQGSASGAGAQFGTSVAMSGNYAIVGSVFEVDDRLVNAGAAYIFERTPGGWVQRARLHMTGGEGGEEFGRAVAIHGDVAIVSAPGADRPPMPMFPLVDAGAALVYRRSGDSWTLEQLLRPDDVAGGDRFGSSVAIEGEWALIGAENADRPNAMAGGNDGAVYVFRKEGASWVQKQKIVPNQVKEGDLFGSALAIDGEWAVSGAINGKITGPIGAAITVGTAYLLRRQGDTWSVHQRLVASDAASPRNFGGAVAIRDDLMAVGDRSNSGQRAYVFRFNGNDWIEEAALRGSDTSTTNDNFGTSVAIDGDRLFVGARLDDDNGLVNSGSLFVFERGLMGWLEAGKLYPLPWDRFAAARFGHAVAMDGNYVLCGAITGTGQPGSVFAFTIDVFDDCDGNGVSDDCDIRDGSATDLNGNGTIDSCECSSDVECDDGRACTNDTCNLALSRCEFAINPGFCLIGGQCVAEGATNPPNECQACHPLVNATRWTNKPEGTLCTEDGIFCTGVERCVTGLCRSPGDPCTGDPVFYTCDENRDRCVNCLINADCDDANECTDDVCVDDACQNLPRPAGTFCGDDSATDCTAPDTCDGAGACLPNHAPDGAACTDDGLFCTGLEQCADGQCESLGDPCAAVDLFCDELGGECVMLDADCNANGRPDFLDIRDSVSLDCNENLVPDECELTVNDCNTNGIPDDCDLAFGISQDCNGNGTPDECDIADAQLAKLTASDATANAYFGSSIAIDNDTIVVGARGDNHAGPWSGSAYVYRKVGGLWRETAKLTAPDALAYDQFGSSVALYGDTTVIGAPGDDDKGKDSGSAYVFREVNGGWEQIAKLTALDGAAGDALGISVSISGDTLVVGSYLDDDACTGSQYCDSGSAYVFREVNGVWRQVAKLRASDQVVQAYFGVRVSISDDTIAVGAYVDGVGNLRPGAAYVFREVGSSWRQVAKLKATDGMHLDYFGISVALDGETLIVGAMGDDDLGPQSGSAYVFRETDGQWQQFVKLTAPDGVDGHYFGESVYVAGDVVAIGGSFSDPAGISRGSGYVFRESSGSWRPVAKLVADDGAAWGQLGGSGSAGGDLLVVGAERNYHHGKVNAGSAYIFRVPSPDCNGNGVPDECDLADGTSADCNGNGIPDDCELGSNDCNGNGVPDECDLADGSSADCNGNAIPDDCELGPNDCNGNGVPDDCDIADGASPDCNFNGVPDECDITPVQIAKLTALDALAYDNFGFSVAISGDTLVIGAPQNNEGHYSSGKAYVFQRENQAWVEVARLRASDAALADAFGSSVSLRGDMAVIGAYGDDDAGFNSGAAYVFRKIDGVWQQVAKLTASDAAAGDFFGFGVSTDGTLALVGANRDDDAGPDSGAAYLFREVDGVWQQVAKLVAADAAANDQFGVSVSLNGGTAVIGSYLDDDGGSESGSAYVFRDLGGTWQQVAKLTADDAEPGDRFGFSVSVERDSIAVGALFDGDLGLSSGSAYVFHKTGGSWQQVEKLTASDGSAVSWFGGSVALSGDTAVIGARLARGAGTIDSGAVYVFRDAGTDWHEVAKLVASSPRSYTQFGSSVSISGDTMIVGEPFGYSTSGLRSGSAYVFRIPSPDCNGNGVPDECDVAYGDSADCNGNEIPDECETRVFEFASPMLTPIGIGQPQRIVVPAPPPAGHDVAMRIFARADLLALNERIDVVLNGMYVGSVFQSGANDCPLMPDQAVLLVPRAVFNTAAADGELVIDLFATPAVNPTLCFPSTFISLDFAYQAVIDGDCNGNGVPDDCDILYGDSLDVNPADGVPDECAPPCTDVLFSDPPHCAIDARQPHPLDDNSLAQGWDRVALTLAAGCDCSAWRPADFRVHVHPADALPPVIAAVHCADATATVLFDWPILPRHWTCVEVIGGDRVCLGCLPGDVNASRAAGAADVAALIDSLNQVPGFVRPLYATDINRSGAANAQDILRLIDGLNGAGAFTPWLGAVLPPCPAPGP